MLPASGPGSSYSSRRESLTVEIVVSQETGRVPVTIFHISGEIAAGSYKELEQQADEAFEAGMRDLLLDLTAVTFLSSSGLRAFHHIFTLLRTDSAEDSDATVRKGVMAGTYKSPHLKLLRPSRTVLKVLQVSGFDMFLDVHSDLQEAVDSF
jgi:anti-anti-sigma factor